MQEESGAKGRGLPIKTVDGDVLFEPRSRHNASSMGIKVQGIQIEDTLDEEQQERQRQAAAQERAKAAEQKKLAAEEQVSAAACCCIG